MSTLNLDKIFSPQRIAVIGASIRPGSVGHSVFQNLVRGGFDGPVYPVNPKYETLDGRRCVASVVDLPETPDLAVICTPADTVAEVVRQCGEAGIFGLVILSAGFREASADGALLEAQIRQVATGFPGMRILGPNCLGFIVPHASLNASFASDSPPRGRVAFISQSGALCTAILDWAIAEGVGFSQFVSLGNMLDVGFADLIDHFATDGVTQSVILYVESITEVRAFMSAARAFTRTRPIIAYKAGRFAQSAQAAASHTGAMAAVDSVYEAAFNRAGIVRVFDIEDLFDCAELLARHPTPPGDRLAIVTNAGGPGVMATDALLDRGGKLAELSKCTIELLNGQLPANWSHRNPVDVIGDAPPERIAAAVTAVLADQAVDGVLVILTPQSMTDPTRAAQAVVAAAQHSRKPVLASWMGGDKMQPGIELLHQAAIPTYSMPEKCVRAFMHLVQYARNTESLYETPRQVSIPFALDRQQRRSKLDELLKNHQQTFSECESKALLAAYDIPVNRTEAATTHAEALAIAARLGYPVVLKLDSPDITHKTEVKGVELNLATPAELIEAYDRILDHARQIRPDAVLRGVTVQPMCTLPLGRELILGARRDPVFGPAILVGAGGITAELFHDRALELPPLNEHCARRMLGSLQIWPLLQGYRGRPGLNIDRLIEVMIRLSRLVEDCPELIELDINPLLLTPDDAIALDARMMVDRHGGDGQRPHSHLAIAPYPDQYVTEISLGESSSFVLRPIMPEDEPLWHRLLAECSLETIEMRFRYLFKSTTHAMAVRFCFLDYDREIAIVAETRVAGERKLAGVARLVADPDHHQAEYAVLVGDHWQNIGLGAALTDHCLAICRDWNIASVVAEIAPHNHRMIHLFRERGFSIEQDVSHGAVIARKSIASNRQAEIAANSTIPAYDASSKASK
ncbi:MAG: GNAT family N-acetyltransferase [Planctomycetaceae bacterium]